jgi:hypothetical protein
MSRTFEEILPLRLEFFCSEMSISHFNDQHGRVHFVCLRNHLIAIVMIASKA